MMIGKVDGGYVNSDCVRRMEDAAEPCAEGAATVLYLKEGGTVRVIGDADELADEINSTIIPAIPGYAVIETDGDYSEPFMYWETPVIAWAITPNDIKPITETSIVKGFPTILRPNGSVTDQNITGADHRTMADWEAAAREVWAERVKLPANTAV